MQDVILPQRHDYTLASESSVIVTRVQPPNHLASRTKHANRKVLKTFCYLDGPDFPGFPEYPNTYSIVGANVSGRNV